MYTNHSLKKELKKNCRAILVKFISLNYCNRAYRQKKNLNDDVSVYVDLTQYDTLYS